MEHPPPGSPPETYEAWFLARGIPHFIADYSATRDVFTRAAPLLAVVFLAEMAGALNLDWPLWANVAAIFGAIAVVAAGWATINRLRNRPPLARPDDIGTVELSAFVLLPALLPLLFGGQVLSAVVTALANAALVAIIYLGTSYGVVPMTRWGIGRLGDQARNLVGLLARALPLLLLFVTFLFINAEVWQLGADLDAIPFALAVGLFVAIGIAFVVARLPQDLDELESSAGATDAPPLSARERANVILLLLFAQALQILAVTVMIGLFFVAFGFVAISTDTIALWTTAAEPDVLWSVDVGGHELALTAALLRVAGFLAAFSGLYFAVYLVTDETYRREFRAEVTDDIAAALAARAAYRAGRGAG